MAGPDRADAPVPDALHSLDDAQAVLARRTTTLPQLHPDRPPSLHPDGDSSRLHQLHDCGSDESGCAPRRAPGHARANGVVGSRVRPHWKEAERRPSITGDLRQLDYQRYAPSRLATPDKFQRNGVARSRSGAGGLTPVHHGTNHGTDEKRRPGAAARRRLDPAARRKGRHDRPRSAPDRGG